MERIVAATRKILQINIVIKIRNELIGTRKMTRAGKG